MESLLNRIIINDAICNGKPTIRGLRITVQTVVEFLLAGDTYETILNAYPVLEKEDLDACKEFNQKIILK